MVFPGAGRLRELLQSTNRRQVAKDLGIHYTTLMGYQAGRRAPDVANLIALCRYLDVSADELLGLHPSGTAVAEAAAADRQSRIHRLEDENARLQHELERLLTERSEVQPCPTR